MTTNFTLKNRRKKKEGTEEENGLTNQYVT